MACNQYGSRLKLEIKHEHYRSLPVAKFIHLPGQMNTFLCVLALSMNFIMTLGIFNNFDTFAIARLFQTVPSNHIKLTDLILKLLRNVHKITHVFPKVAGVDN